MPWNRRLKGRYGAKNDVEACAPRRGMCDCGPDLPWHRRGRAVARAFYSIPGKLERLQERPLPSAMHEDRSQARRSAPRSLGLARTHRFRLSNPLALAYCEHAALVCQRSWKAHDEGRSAGGGRTRWRFHLSARQAGALIPLHVNVSGVQHHGRARHRALDRSKWQRYSSISSVCRGQTLARIACQARAG